LSWIEDESNADDAYDRNFLRLRVLPALNARWPHFADAVARSAALCGEQEQLLDELLADELAAATHRDGGLSIAALETLSAARRAAILRRWLSAQQAPMPSREMLLRVWQEVALAREMQCHACALAIMISAVIRVICGGLRRLRVSAKKFCNGRILFCR
jgi:tRNA(Ile)-lysidine synthase